MPSLLARNDSKGKTTMTPVSARRLGRASITPADVAIGVRARALRKERGMSQSVLAEAIGVTFQQVQKYENGTNRLSGARIGQIAAVFDVPPASLLGTSEARLEQSLGDRMTSTRKGCRIAAACLALEPIATDMIVNLAEWLLLMQEKGK